MNSNHTFVICAYKESAYLEECILSLQRQTIPSHILMVTSTPCDFIQRLADQYHIPLFVNTGKSGITEDWNFGLEQVQTHYATVAHQDDTYEPTYAQRILEAMGQVKQPIIAFCDYSELREGIKVYDNKLLHIKKLMLKPLKPAWTWSKRWIRRRVLSLGDPICCPAVTFDLSYIQKPVFVPGFRSCEDWQAWEMLSRLKGSFIYIAEPLMSHRIHQESATTAILGDNARVEENYIMYCKFWPKPIAKLINHFYTSSEDSNQLAN